MKTFKNLIKKQEFAYSLALILAIVIITLFTDNPTSILFAAVVPGIAGKGEHVTGEPLTTTIVNEASPELNLSEIDKRITKIRPMSTPIDQISRFASARSAGSMKVDYYSVDTKPTSTTLQDAYTEPETGSATQSHKTATLNTKNNDMFDVSDTILVKGIPGYNDSGEQSGADLILYISKKSDDGKLIVYAVNGKKIGSIDNCVPSITAGTQLIRMGRAATELDVQTAQFESLPVKDFNYCQIFKMQVEQATFQKLQNKEVDWNLSDQEECAIYDMRLGAEKSFMFGERRIIRDASKKEDVYFTKGIWWQAGKEKEYDTKNDLTVDTLIDIMQAAFTGNAGNKRKILLGGSGFISRLNKIDYSRIIDSQQAVTLFGIDFSELVSKFGRLDVLHDEVFDDCGMSDYAFILDPEYLDKWNHVAFSRFELDLKKAGIRNTDAVVLSEACCLTLRYPGAHMRIVPEP